jgi:peptide deformylase
MKLPLAYYGDPILRKKGSPVTKFDNELAMFVTNMVDTMNAHNGQGLAAQQVYQPLNIFITHVAIEGPNDTWLPGDLRVFINPKIIKYSEEVWIWPEGCLSIPKLYEDVMRPFNITVTAQDLNGKEFTEEFRGHQARAIMHENDHINGVLFIDRIHGKRRKEIEAILRNIKKTYQK